MHTYISNVQIMGFQSPEADFTESRISLDAQFISHPSATYFMRTAEMYYRVGIMNGALLVIDSSLKLCGGPLLKCAIDGEMRVKLYMLYPQPNLENLSNGMKERLLTDRETTSDTQSVFWVITYIINDARSGEFDDCPVTLDQTKVPKALHWIARLCAIRWCLSFLTPPFHQANPPTTASFLCAYRDTEHGCKFSKRRNVFDKKLAQEDKKSPCANALL